MNGPVRRMAVVTGGAGSIGASITGALTAAGHQVTVLDRAGPEPVDLGDEQQVRAAAHRVLETAGRCDVLVHAAAAFDQATLEQVDLALWRRVQAVNVESALLLAQAFVPGMAARGFGRIIFVVSDTVWAPPAAGLLPYVTSNGALVAMARTLAVAHGADGIAVTCVAPGLTATPAARAGMPAAAFEAVRDRQALPAPWCPRTWRPRWRSWPRMARPRSPGRRCVPTAAWSCAELASSRRERRGFLLRGSCCAPVGSCFTGTCQHGCWSYGPSAGGSLSL